MDLMTIRRERRLKYIYQGSSIQPGGLLYKPIKITQFEITASTLHPGKDMVVAQVVSVSKDGEITQNILFTESYTLLSTLKGTEDSLPHYTKITRKKDGYYYFVILNEKEKEILSKI